MGVDTNQQLLDNDISPGQHDMNIHKPRKKKNI